MPINLKNYTTEVPANRSIDNIEKLLIQFGAFNIMKQYDTISPLPGRICTGLSFIIEINGMRIPFKLPANIAAVAMWLDKQNNRSTKANYEQANRICWKQQHEILHLQLSQVLMNQADALEIFLPYVYDIAKDETYYNKLKSEDFKQLTIQ